MANELQGKKIAFLVANSGVEEAELVRPAKRSKRRAGRPSS